MPEELRLKIADIVFSILPAGAIKGFSLDKNYIPFVTGNEPDVVLRTARSNPPCPPFSKGGQGGFGTFSGQRQTFTTDTWDYCQADGRNIFNFSYSSKNNRPERRLVLDNDFKTGEIILGKTVRAKNGVLRNPFSYPLDQLLMISLLPQMQGFLIHSCGFIYKDKGYLFVGSSGAGKSTMAKILGRNNPPVPPFRKGGTKGGFGKGILNKNISILSDDRIVARKKNDCFYIYGTPWHGTEEIVSPENAPLAGLFFLKKDEKNSLQKISLPDAVSRLIKCSFPPFWHREGIASTLKICEDIATSIPCFEFSFTPDDRAFALIRKKGLI